MAATDLVPCFYTGQNYRVEKPAELRVRSEVRELKKRNLGTFVHNGTLFLFSRAIVKKMSAPYDGPLGVGNLLPFAKENNYGDKLHYEIPHAGDRGLFARHHRKLIRVSARSRSYPAAAVLPTHTFASTLLAG